jgi:GT2 family glycosyltransferase
MQYLIKNEYLYYDALRNNYRFNLYELPFVNAAAWLIPRKVFFDVGGFDPIFFHYGEDTNYCQRILFHNYKIGVLSQAFILHDREHREPQVTVPYSDQYYETDKKDLKVIYANINISYPRNIHYLVKKILLKSSIKKLLKLNFKGFVGNFKKYGYLNTLFELIYRSRDIAQIKGSHYLTLK